MIRRNPLEVLYEDNHLIAVNKRPGDISQGDATGDDPLGEEVKQYIKEKYYKPGAVFLGVTHRLDRPVSGVILFARTSKALSRITTMFRDDKIQKTYLALVLNKPPKKQDTLRHWLTRSSNKNVTYASEKQKPNSKEAILSYEYLKQTDQGHHLLLIRPKTGRQHQIRVQLQAIGCPIIGDIKYGAKKPLPDKSIALHAWKLELFHPVKKEPLVIEAKPPDNGIWD